MATEAFRNSIALCLSRLQSERNDSTMRRQQRHAEQALMQAWLSEYPASFDDAAYQHAQDAIRSFVRGEGRAMLKRMTVKRFVQMYKRLDWSQKLEPINNYDNNWNLDTEPEAHHTRIIEPLCYACRWCALDREASFGF